MLRHIASNNFITASRMRDFAGLEREARASMQAAKDQADAIAKELESTKSEAQKILEDVRRIAAEQGVSQQAVYFKQENELYNNEGWRWQIITLVASSITVAFAILSLVFHNVEFIRPHNLAESIQIATGKLIVFIVLGYIVVLAARNFLAHKHNAVVNKHRQNALLTFEALVDAAGSEENRDIVLTYASACILASQKTGYTRGATQPELPNNILHVTPRLSPQSQA